MLPIGDPKNRNFSRPAVPHALQPLEGQQMRTGKLPDAASTVDNTQRVDEGAPTPAMRPVPAGEPQVTRVQQAAESSRAVTGQQSVAVHGRAQAESPVDPRAKAFELATPFLDPIDAWNLSIASKANNEPVNKGAQDSFLQDALEAQSECHMHAGEHDAARRNQAVRTLRFRAAAEKHVRSSFALIQEFFDRDPAYYADRFGPMLAQQGRLDDAERVLRWGISAYPEDSDECREALVEVLMRRGDYDQASREAQLLPMALEDSRRQILEASIKMLQNPGGSWPEWPDRPNLPGKLESFAWKNDAAGAIRCLSIVNRRLPSDSHYIFVSDLDSPCLGPLQKNPTWLNFLDRCYMTQRQLAAIPLHVPDRLPPLDDTDATDITQPD